MAALVMLDTNPVYTAPGDLDVVGAIAKVPLRIRCGTAVDETSAYADWHLPRAHSLESWGDARARDGTVSLHQPTVRPLYDGRTDTEVLSILTDAQPRDGLAILRHHHARGRDPAGFDAFWRQTLLDGFVAGSAFARGRDAGPRRAGSATAGAGFGYGRPVPDILFSGLGYSAFPLRTAAEPWMRPGATLTKLGRQVRLATTQDHSTLEGHDLVELRRVGGPKVESFPVGAPSFSNVTAREADGRAWGMVVDQDACIGCNACVVSCQAENNVPVVGAHEVIIGREMRWLRVDRYYSGLKTGAGLDDPDTHFQPVPCMHCEEASREVGCPVEATLHDHEGLNLMVYNRGVGTRACSGSCPYKVRHFDSLDYTGGMAPVARLQRNPEVTVRARGVMEKCTYRVQRIASARIESDKTNAPIADGAVRTACQAACPTRAITFGDLEDEGSAVLAARRDPRNYALLGELDLKPRTTSLAELAPAAEAAAPGAPLPSPKGPA